MKQEIKEIFERFEGDLTSLALYAYLSPLLNANERKLISLKELALKTGYGRRRLLKTLDRLQEIGVIFYEIQPGNGVSVLPKCNSAIHFVISEFTNVNSALHFVTSALTNVNSLTKSEYPLECEVSEHSLPLLKEEGLNLKLKTETKAKLTPKPKSPSTSGRKPRKKKLPAKPKEKTLGAKIWEAYADEYQKVYGITPPRNAKANANTAQIGQRIGEDALQVIRFYVHHKDRFFVLKRHPLGLALSEAERLYADWKLGTNITSFDANRVERNDSIKKFFETF